MPSRLDEVAHVLADVVVDVQLVEKLFQLCFGIRIVSVLGEPHLHFELFLCGEFVFEIFV